MEDEQIIALYWQREESAIAETERKYGTFCRAIARNILTLPEDAEECVSDTWYQAWNAMPPQRPARLRAWLGRVTRNLAINRWHHQRAQKRYAGAEQLLSELEDCVPAPAAVEQQLEGMALTQVIDAWLAALPKDDRVLFLRRYWYGIPLQTLAREWGISANRLAQRMYRLRGQLRAALEQEGIRL